MKLAGGSLQAFHSSGSRCCSRNRALHWSREGVHACDTCVCMRVHPNTCSTHRLINTFIIPGLQDGKLHSLYLCINHSLLEVYPECGIVFFYFIWLSECCCQRYSPKVSCIILFVMYRFNIDHETEADLKNACQFIDPALIWKANELVTFAQLCLCKTAKIILRG